MNGGRRRIFDGVGNMFGDELERLFFSGLLDGAFFIGRDRRFFGFRQLGERRASPRVCGAPALLLHLDMAEYTGAMDARRAGASSGYAPIFSRFLAPEREAEAAAWLAEQHRPMSAAEMERFALAPVAVA